LSGEKGTVEMKDLIIFMLLFGISLPISYAAAAAESSRQINAGDNGVAFKIGPLRSARG
jgi:hypothetical protein